MIRRAVIALTLLSATVPTAHAGPSAVVCSFKGTMFFETVIYGHDPELIHFGGSGTLPGYCATLDGAAPAARVQRATASFERWEVDLLSHPSPPPTTSCSGGPMIMDFVVQTKTGSASYEFASSVFDWPGIQGETPIANTDTGQPGVFSEGIFGKCPPGDGPAQVALTFTAVG